MVIYPPSQRSNATFEQPKWAQNNTSEREVSFTETPLEYEATPLDSQTSPVELTSEALEAAADHANVKFIMQASEEICALRQFSLNQ